MKKRPKILICGDAGAVGPELIRRQDLQILWALSVKEAQAVLWKVQPEVCLMEEEFAHSILAVAPETDGTVYLILEKEKYPRTIRAIDQAAYVPATDGSLILGAIAKAIGLKFSQQPRVKADIEVEITCGDFTGILQTTDVSLSGLSVKGFPEAPSTDLATLRFVSSHAIEPVNAVLIRTFGEDDKSAAFRFEDLDQDNFLYLRSIVSDGLDEVVEPEPVNTRALMKKKLFTSPDEEVVTEEEKEHLFALLENDLVPTKNCPEWITRLGKSLTQTERSVAQGESGPNWVESSLNLRAACEKLDLAERVPGSLRNLVLSFCRSLTTRGAEYSDDVIVDVTAVRGSLIGQVFRDQQTRFGAVPESELAVS